MFDTPVHGNRAPVGAHLDVLDVRLFELGDTSVTLWRVPPPLAHLLGMTAGAFAFELTARTSAVQRKSAIITVLNFAINDKLAANSIEFE